MQTQGRGAAPSRGSLLPDTVTIHVRTPAGPGRGGATAAGMATAIPRGGMAGRRVAQAPISTGPVPARTLVTVRTTPNPNPGGAWAAATRAPSSHPRVAPAPVADHPAAPVRVAPVAITPVAPAAAPARSANANQLLALLSSALAGDDSTHALVAQPQSVREIGDMIDPADTEAARTGMALLALVAIRDPDRGEAIASVLLGKSSLAQARVIRLLASPDSQTKTCALQLLSVLLRYAPDTAAAVDHGLRAAPHQGLRLVLAAIGSDQPEICDAALGLLAALARALPARAATLFLALSRSQGAMGLQALVQRMSTMPELRGPTCALLAALARGHAGRKAAIHDALARQAGGIGLQRVVMALESRDIRTHDAAVDLLAELAADDVSRRHEIGKALQAPGFTGRFAIYDRLRTTPPDASVFRLLRSFAQTGWMPATEVMVELSLHDRVGLKRLIFAGMTPGARQGDALALLACLTRAKPLWGRLIFTLASCAGDPLRGLDSLVEGLSPLEADGARHALQLLHALCLLGTGPSSAIHEALRKLTPQGCCGLDAVIELAGAEDSATQREALSLLAELSCQSEATKESLLDRLTEGPAGQQGLDRLVVLLDNPDPALRRVLLALLTELALHSPEAGRDLLDRIAPEGQGPGRLIALVAVMLYRPAGLWPDAQHRREMAEKKS